MNAPHFKVLLVTLLAIGTVASTVLMATSIPPAWKNQWVYILIVLMNMYGAFRIGIDIITRHRGNSPMSKEIH